LSYFLRMIIIRGEISRKTNYSGPESGGGVYLVDSARQATRETDRQREREREREKGQREGIRGA
jgi:hypothetical protein